MEFLHGGQARLLFEGSGDENEVMAQVLPSQTKVTVKLDEGWKAHCFPGREGLLRAFGVAWQGESIRLSMKEGSVLLLHPSVHSGISMGAFKWFSGLGGWHCGLQLAAKSTKIMVDFDEEVCRVARQRLNRASNCQSKVLTPEAFLPRPWPVCVGRRKSFVVERIPPLSTKGWAF